MKSTTVISTVHVSLLLVTLIPQMLAMKLDLDSSPCAQLPEYMIESCAAAEAVYEAFVACYEFLNHADLRCTRQYQSLVSNMPVFSA